MLSDNQKYWGAKRHKTTQQNRGSKTYTIRGFWARLRVAWGGRGWERGYIHEWQSRVDPRDYCTLPHYNIPQIQLDTTTMAILFPSRHFSAKSDLPHTKITRRKWSMTKKPSWKWKNISSICTQVLVGLRHLYLSALVETALPLKNSPRCANLAYSRFTPNSTKWARFCDHNKFLTTTPIIKLFLMEI